MKKVLRVGLIILHLGLVCIGSSESMADGSLRIGAASKIINPAVGDWVQGAGAARQGTAIRDDLEANALYISDGKTPLLLVSCDLVGLSSDWAKRIREAMAKATDIPARNILLTCTHTHGGPSLLRTNYLMPIDIAYLERLEVWLVELAKESLASAQDGQLGWGKGEAQIGYNRRLCWADGTHTMHGDSKRPDFVGLEGADNPQHVALFAADAAGKLIAVLHHNTSHPTIYYAAGVFSADFPGKARTMLREELGDIPVLFLNGAQGDIAIQNQLNPIKETREEKLDRIGGMVAAETLRLYKEVEYHDAVPLAHSFKDLEVGVRLPTPEKLADAREVLAKIDAGDPARGMKMIMAFGAVHLQEVYGENPVDTLPVHALRIGDLGLITQPCELYVQFALDIEARSPAPITAVIGLADGYCGYCPTVYGILGGGYSAAPISWTRLEPAAGYKIVESAVLQLDALWR